jgi:lipid-A-disaccharide synthase
VAHNLGPLAGGLRILAARHPGLQLALAVAPGLGSGLFEPLERLPVLRLAGHNHSLMGSATVGLVASGTATVEAALLRLPMVVVYRLSPLTYALGRPFVRVPHYAMVNLIAGKRVAKELIQREFTPETVAAEAGILLSDPARREAMRAELAGVREALGPPGASERAAQVVATLMGHGTGGGPPGGQLPKKLDGNGGYM